MATTVLSPAFPLSFNRHPSTLHRLSHLCHPKTLSLRNPSELHHHKHHHNPLEHSLRKRLRGDALVTRAGPPSATTLAYAFVIPLSLILATVLASIRIGERLDGKFIEELEKNKAAMEEDEDSMIDYEDGEDDEGDGEGGVNKLKDEDKAVAVEATGAPPVTRNRPKKLVQ